MSVSQVPVYVLAGFAVAALALLLVAGWLGIRLRGSTDRAARALQAGLVGVALAFVSLVIAGQRHYGGTATGLAGYSCDVWYQEAGLPSGQRALPGDLSPACRHDALAAIGPAVGWAALVGVVGGGVFFAVVWSWRRYRARPRRVSATRYVDTDS